MSIEEVKQKVREFLIEEFEIDEEKIYDDARLKEDVGIDSLDYVDIVVVVKRKFGFKIGQGELTDIKTLGQFYEYISSKVEG
ncbi:MAG: acyl carrier protein [Prevotella sp.]|nr:acyl carrier protein [Prevotella sp.]MBR4572449.1 acyl carrier protein [Prevotella sp.]